MIWQQNYIQMRDRGNNTYIGTNECPTCGHKLNNATPVSGQGVSDDLPNIGLCAYCGELIAFIDDEIIKVPDDVLEHLKTDQPEYYTYITESQKYFKEELNGKNKTE